MNCLLRISVRRNNYFPERVSGLAENDNARIHSNRFLGQGVGKTQHSTGEQVSLYRASSEIYAQENIFVVSFHQFSDLVSN